MKKRRASDADAAHEVAAAKRRRGAAASASVASCACGTSQPGAPSGASKGGARTISGAAPAATGALHLRASCVRVEAAAGEDELLRHELKNLKIRAVVTFAPTITLVTSYVAWHTKEAMLSAWTKNLAGLLWVSALLNVAALSFEVLAAERPASS